MRTLTAANQVEKGSHSWSGTAFLGAKHLNMAAQASYKHMKDDKQVRG